METHKSTQLIKALSSAEILSSNLPEDKVKEAQRLIRESFCIIHNEAVLATVMAVNKGVYVQPNFYD